MGEESKRKMAKYLEREAAGCYSPGRRNGYTPPHLRGNYKPCYSIHIGHGIAPPPSTVRPVAYVDARDDGNRDVVIMTPVHPNPRKPVMTNLSCKPAIVVTPVTYAMPVPFQVFPSPWIPVAGHGLHVPNSRTPSLSPQLHP